MVHHSVFSVVFGLISIGTEIFCSRIPGLTSRQREMCKAYPDAMVAVGDGIRLATNECRYQFRHNRWNCSGIENPTSFGHVVIVGEFIYWFKHGIRSRYSTSIHKTIVFQLYVNLLETNLGIIFKYRDSSSRNSNNRI